MIGRNHAMFLHSPESWKDLWEGQVFEQGEIRVDTHLVEVARKSDEQAEAEEDHWLIQFNVHYLMHCMPITLYRKYGVYCGQLTLILRCESSSNLTRYLVWISR